MSNLSRGVIDVVINQTTYTLIYDTNTLAEIEEYFDKSIVKILNVESSEMQSFRVIRALLWVGLKQRKRQLKIEDVGRMMRVDEMPGYVKSIGEVLNSIMPHSEDKKDEAAEAADPQMMESQTMAESQSVSSEILQSPTG